MDEMARCLGHLGFRVISRFGPFFEGGLGQLGSGRIFSHIKSEVCKFEV